MCLCAHLTARLPPLSQMRSFPSWSQAQRFCPFGHSQDSCLGIPLVFSDFILSGQCKNSLGLLVPSFTDYFSSLWFYRSPSLHLALGPTGTSSWVCSRLMGTSSPSPGESCSIASLQISSQNVALLRSPQTLASARLCGVVTAVACADSGCLPVCPSSPFLFPSLPSILCF